MFLRRSNHVPVLSKLIYPCGRKEVNVAGRVQNGRRMEQFDDGRNERRKTFTRVKRREKKVTAATLTWGQFRSQDGNKFEYMMSFECCFYQLLATTFIGQNGTMHMRIIIQPATRTSLLATTAPLDQTLAAKADGGSASKTIHFSSRAMRQSRTRKGTQQGPRNGYLRFGESTDY